MSTERKIVIKDACIFFDLLDLNLMESFYYLGYDVSTTSYVLQEITDSEQLAAIRGQIEKGNLKIDDTGAVDDIQQLLSENKGLSFTDSSVLELALRKNCTILSSDGLLRKVSERNRLAVRGMLWLIEAMCEANLIAIDVALEKLNLYPKINKRAAPKKSIEELAERLKTKK